VLEPDIEDMIAKWLRECVPGEVSYMVVRRIMAGT
jgi:hypothetical protein